MMTSLMRQLKAYNRIMSEQDLIAIYNEMKSVFARDKNLTHIEVIFKIQPVKTEKKIARITVTTYKNEI